MDGKIGSGGMGEVVLVHDRDLRRQIAMKVMRPELVRSKAHRDKFAAEAQATAQLEHPGIPPVHDMGISLEGTLYFTMKLVRGRTLREILKDLYLGVKEARREYTLHRLVTVLEREKAARGVDGRRFPWGDLEDPTLGKCRDSREERGQPEPAGSFPTARSVYGMEDAAGNVWDWTDSWFRDEAEGTRALRGGAWGNPTSFLRCANRNRNDPTNRNATVDPETCPCATPSTPTNFGGRSRGSWRASGRGSASR